MSSLSPLVSVIITTYNRANLVVETIQSVLSQTYKKFELIIVDDGSEDDTKDVVECFADPRIEYIYIPNSGGPARPRNIGIKRAKGQYIAFCDDDDLWFPNKLEDQINHLDSNDIIGVGSETISFDKGKEHKKNERNRDIYLDFEKIAALRSGVALSSLIIRNKGVLFDESECFVAVEDFDFQLKLTIETRKCIKVLSKPLVRYRLDSSNKISGLNQSLNALNVIERYKEFLPEAMEGAIRSKMYYKIGKQQLALQLSKESRKYFVRSLKNGSLTDGKMIKSILGIIITLMPILIERYIIKIIFD